MHIIVSALVKINEKYLLCLRGPGAYPYAWEFPSMELEEGETIEESLERLMFCELGLNVGKKSLLNSFTAKIAGELYVFYLVSVHVLGGRFTLGMYKDASLVSSTRMLQWNLAPHMLKQFLYL